MCEPLLTYGQRELQAEERAIWNLCLRRTHGCQQKGKKKKKEFTKGWGFSSVVEHLPSKRKALGSVPSSEKKKEKKKEFTNIGSERKPVARSCRLL